MLLQRLTWILAATVVAAAGAEPSTDDAPAKEKKPSGAATEPAAPARPDEAAKPGEAESAKQPAEPPIKELDAERVQIGKVILNKKTREIRFPAAVNMAGGELLEFIIVHVNGKVHESLLSTETSPLHLNLALKLLRYKPSPELYAENNPDGTLSDRFPKVADDVKEGSRLEIKVEWKEGEKTRTALVNEWISNTHTGAAMPADPWVYGGSLLHNGQYAAEDTGDIAAIFLSRAAIINFPGKDNQDDEVWVPFPKRVPAVGTPVTVIFTPQRKDASPPKP